MKNLLRFITVLSLLFSIQANAITTPKYVVVDVEKIFAKSEAYKNFKKSWDQENSKYQKEIEFYETEIAKINKILIGHHKNLSDMDANNLKYRLGQYETKIQQLVQTRKIKMDEQFGIAKVKLIDKIDKL